MVEHQYYDLSFRNNVTNGVNNYSPLIFRENRDSPIIQNCRNYKLTICRFYIDTQALPLFIPEIQYNSPDANRTAYTFTLSYDDGSGAVVDEGPEHIIYRCQDTTLRTPKAPAANPPYYVQAGYDGGEAYYYIYQMQHFITLMNETLTTVFNNLQATVGAPLASAEQPYFQWDSNTNKAILYAQKDFYSDEITPSLITPKINIYCNRALQTLFSSFYYETYQFNAPNNKNYRFILNSLNNIQVISIPGSSDLWIKNEQEISTISTLSPVSSIAFCSSTIPVSKNLVSSPHVIVNGTNYSLNKAHNGIQNIITDFYSSENGCKEHLEYAPNLYRWIDLIADNDLSEVEVSVRWQGKSGQYYPLYLRPNSSATIKLLFQKKGIS